MPPPLSILDLSPVSEGMTSAQAAANSLDLASRADGWGYARYWVAEHHSTPAFACPAPEVLIGHIAARTRNMRIGSGGIMLPNHSPLHVAEAFRLLEALHPGRIDLGLGRAPGTDGITAHALRRGSAGGEDFAQDLAMLLAFADGGFPAGHAYARVTAEPAGVPLPPVWILGSSDYGPRAAAEFGVGFAFARHLNPRQAPELMRAYRRSFRPSPGMPEPRSILALSAVCATDADEARFLIGSMAKGMVRMRQGTPIPIPSPEDAASTTYTPDEEDQIRRYMRSQILGSPSEVRAQLEELAHECEADEVMVMTLLYDHEARCQSYRSLAAAFADGEGAAAA